MPPPRTVAHTGSLRTRPSPHSSDLRIRSTTEFYQRDCRTVWRLGRDPTDRGCTWHGRSSASAGSHGYASGGRCKPSAHTQRRTRSDSTRRRTDQLQAVSSPRPAEHASEPGGHVDPPSLHAPRMAFGAEADVSGLLQCEPSIGSYGATGNRSNEICDAPVTHRRDVRDRQESARR